MVLAVVNALALDAVPLNVPVIVPVEKSPLLSLLTIVFGVLTEVAELTDFGDLNVYPENVEWSGKILELDLEFFFSINEPNGLYVKGDMVKVDQDYMGMIGKLQSYYEKFKAKWSKVVASRQEDVEE